MTDEAYNALNGLSYTTKKGRKIKTPYPSTNEGFKRLIKDYGTHLLRRADLGGKMKYSTTIDLSKVENEYYNGDWWLMQLRMVQPLNVKTK